MRNPILPKNVAIEFNLKLSNPYDTATGCRHKESKMAKAAKKSAKKSTAKVAKSTAKKAVVAKSTTKKAVTPVAKKPNELHQALINLMTRPEGAAIADFQQIPGFAIPSMAALRIAERAGFKTSAVKKPGERTRYYAKRA